MNETAFQSLLASGQMFVKISGHSFRPLSAGDNGRAIYATTNGGGYEMMVPGVDVEPPTVPDPTAAVPLEMPSMTPPRRPRRPDGATPPQASWPTWQERPSEPEAPYTEQAAEILVKGPSAVMGFIDSAGGAWLTYCVLPAVIGSLLICALAICVAFPPVGIVVLGVIIWLCCRKKKKVTS